MIEAGGASPSRIAAGLVVNAAGLGAQGVARSIAGMPLARIPAVHLTFDLAGRARFGPDVEWIEAIDYAVDPKRAESFYAAIRSCWTDLPDDSLPPDYAGSDQKSPSPVGPRWTLSFRQKRITASQA
jgi:L-2-hydroxyglutarate oxidase LhgO